MSLELKAEIARMAATIRELKTEVNFLRAQANVAGGGLRHGAAVPDADFYNAFIRAKHMLVDGEEGITFQFGNNDATITKVEDEDKIEYSGDLKVINGEFAATSVKIGDKLLSDSGGMLQIDDVEAYLRLKDTDTQGTGLVAAMYAVDKNDTGVWLLGIGSESDSVFHIFNGYDGDIRIYGSTCTIRLQNNVSVEGANLLMDGSGTDDERLRVPYLTAAPSSVDNGSIWMESDGLHIYYNGSEKIVAGT